MSTTAATAATPHLRACNERSAQVRSRRAAAYEALKAGRVSLPDLLLDLPTGLADEPLYRLVRAQPRIGTRRLGDINRHAMAARINLFLPAGEVGDRTRRWLAEWAVPSLSVCRGCGANFHNEGARRYCDDCREERQRVAEQRARDDRRRVAERERLAEERRARAAFLAAECPKLRDEGLTYPQIADRLGVGRRTAWRWVNQA